MNADPAIEVDLPPGTYTVTVTFDAGTSEREVQTDHKRMPYQIFLQALGDMRCSSGPGLTGRVLVWHVNRVNK